MINLSDQVCIGDQWAVLIHKGQYWSILQKWSSKVSSMMIIIGQYSKYLVWIWPSARIYQGTSGLTLASQSDLHFFIWPCPLICTPHFQAPQPTKFLGRSCLNPPLVLRQFEHCLYPEYIIYFLLCESNNDCIYHFRPYFLYTFFSSI